jgi:ribose transport system ATP-binding protein
MMTPSTATAGCVLSLRNLSKSFGRRRVLDRVDLDISAGEVHALLGQNGSGKSTLIKILSGIHSPDDPAEGEPPASLAVRGQEVALPVDPWLAPVHGLTFVHQDMPIITSASLMENLRIGRFRTAVAAFINWRRERDDVRVALRNFGIEGDPDQLAQDVHDADRAMLAILRGLEGLPADRPGLLILDEPTAHLPRDGVDRVFKAIKKVAHQGHGVLLITHRLDEVFAITDRVSVIRDGIISYVSDTTKSSERDLIRAIVGFELGDLYPERVELQGEYALRVSNLRGKRVRDFSIELRQGEIVGLTGLIGAGQEEIPYLIFGAKKAVAGAIAVGEKVFRQSDLSPLAAMRAGMALLPADRRGASAVGAASVRENISLPVIRRFFRRGFLHKRQERLHVDELLRQFGVSPIESSIPLELLSGGNQQKAMLAKWFQTRPRVLLLHEPTQGVDIASRRAIFGQIKEAASSGTAILLCSAEYADLANLCDRVIVVRNGQKVGELTRGTMTEQRIIAQCMTNDQPQKSSQH